MVVELKYFLYWFLSFLYKEAYLKIQTECLCLEGVGESERAGGCRVTVSPVSQEQVRYHSL